MGEGSRSRYESGYTREGVREREDRRREKGDERGGTGDKIWERGEGI